MRILILVARIITGLAFIFSGTVKAIDPMGSAYKFHDYFQAFNIGFLDSLSLSLAILLCTAEFIAGFSVLTGIKFQSGIKLLMLLMIIFTPLTFILALTNPVSDCGCFGDAVKLTNWQTFWKNVLLISLATILFLNRKKIPGFNGNARGWMIIAAASAVFILFSIYNLRYLPVIDFLPYKKGVKIAEQMKIPEGVAPDKYETTFIYEKDGLKKEFNINNYPANDTSWKFLDQKSVLIKKGYEPPVHDFVITTMQGEDITQKILEHEGSTLLMIVKKLDEADDSRLRVGFELGKHCLNNGIGFYVLTASGTDEIAKYQDGVQFCNVDETTLKTIVRSNPGYMLLKDGTIIDKWSWACLPEKDSIIRMYGK
ncbi:MAG: BT_3928 family protein [Chloroflexota bacterium]